MDGTGTMAVTTVSILLTDLAYFIPITYTPSLYRSAAFAYQLLAILNPASCVGRYMAGWPG